MDGYKNSSKLGTYITMHVCGSPASGYLPWGCRGNLALTSLRHLLDGDPAAIRWAGVGSQACILRAKHLASASNIRKCGAARVASECNHDAGLARLATSAQPPEETLSPRACRCSSAVACAIQGRWD
ncbi:MAG: hypothetical protein CM15mP120_04090 [Pseudomonadota bacterium]|nr:MAG: hypothetical protein CM15mP120_04090 [Pseudomonadota bacterium]